MGLKVVARFRRRLLREQRGGRWDQISVQNMGFPGPVKLEAVGSTFVAQQRQRNTRSVPQFVQNFANLGRAQRRFAAHSHGQFDLAGTDFLQHRGEFQLTHEFRGGVLVDTSPFTTFGRHIEGHVGMYLDQLASKFDIRAILFEQPRDLCTTSNPARGDFRQVCVEIVQVAELLDERGGGLLANAGNPLDVVDRVAGQSLDVDKRARLHPQAFFHLTHPGALVAHRVPQGDPG